MIYDTFQNSAGHTDEVAYVECACIKFQVFSFWDACLAAFSGFHDPVFTWFDLNRMVLNTKYYT